MPSKCCAVGCKVGYKSQGKTPENVTLFVFPKTPELLKKWLKNLSRENFTVTASSRLCSLHFLPSDFETERKDSNVARKKSGGALKSKKLKIGAVPTVFQKRPHYLEYEASTSRDTTKTTAQARTTHDAELAEAEESSFFEQDNIILIDDILERLPNSHIDTICLD